MKTNGYLRFPRGLHKKVSALTFRSQAVFWFLYNEVEPKSKKYTVNKVEYTIKKGQVFTSVPDIMEGITKGCKRQKDKREVTTKKIEKDLFAIKKAGLVHTSKAARNVIITISFYQQYQTLINSDLELGGDSEPENNYKNNGLHVKNEKLGGDSTELGGDRSPYVGGDSKPENNYKSNGLHVKNEKLGGDRNESLGEPLIDKRTSPKKQCNMLSSSTKYTHRRTGTDAGQDGNFTEEPNYPAEDITPTESYRPGADDETLPIDFGARHDEKTKQEKSMKDYDDEFAEYYRAETEKNNFTQEPEENEEPFDLDAWKSSRREG